jgi:hypothetical protein
MSLPDRDLFGDEVLRHYGLIAREIARRWWQEVFRGEPKPIESKDISIEGKKLGRHFAQAHTRLGEPDCPEGYLRHAAVFDGLARRDETANATWDVVDPVALPPTPEQLARLKERGKTVDTRLRRFPELREVLRLWEARPVPVDDETSAISAQAEAPDGPTDSVSSAATVTISANEEHFRYAGEVASPKVPVSPDIEKQVWDAAHHAHYATQDAATRFAEQSGYEPIHPEILKNRRIDTGWVTPDGTAWVCEAKSLQTSEAGKLRLGLGQVLDYRTRALSDFDSVRAVLAVERAPTDADHWLEVCASAGVILVWPDATGSIDIPECRQS